MAEPVYQPVNTPVTEATRWVTKPWRDFFDKIAAVINSIIAGGGPAPGNAPYVTYASDPTLTAERVATDTTTVDVDLGTVGQIKWNVPDGAITFAKLQTVNESKLLGRGQGAGAGVVQEITVGLGLTMSGTTLSASGGGGWIPLVDGAEPPGFITDGAGVLILVPGP